MATNPHAALRRSCAVKKRECVPVLVSAAAGNKSATRPPLPPPRCGGEWKETGRNWRVGIGQFNRTANRGKTGTTTIQIRRKHNNEPHDPDSRSPEQDRCRAPPKPQVRSRRAAPPTGTQRDVTWYGIPGSVWPGGVSPQPPAVPLPGFW